MRAVNTRLKLDDELGPGFVFSPYLIPFPTPSVSVRGRRRSWAGAWPVPVGSTGLLAPGLLLRPTLDSFIPLRKTDCTVTLVGVSSTLVVWSVSVSKKQSNTNTGIDTCGAKAHLLVLTKSLLLLHLELQFNSLPALSVLV